MKTLEYVRTRFQKMKSARQPFEDVWVEDDAAVLAPFYSVDQYASDINLPVEFSHIQHAMAEIVDAPLRVVFNPKNKRGLEKRDIAQSVWDYAWEKSDTDRQMYWWYLSILGLGSGVWFEGYQRITRKKFEKVKLSAEDMRQMEIPQELVDASDVVVSEEPIPHAESENDGYEESEIVEYDDVYGEWVPCKEFYIDDAAKTFWEPTHARDARDCIRRRFYSPEAFYESWSKYPDAAYVTSRTVDDTPKNAEERKREIYSGERIEVKEYWSRVLQRYIVVVNDECIINGPTGEPIPYEHGRMPYAVAPCFPVANSPWGKGLPSLLRGIRSQEDLIMNIGMDQGKNSIQPPLLKASTLELMDEEWYAGMGYILNVQGSLDDIKELPVGQLSNNFFTILDRLEQYEILGTGQDIRSLIKSEPTAFQQANKKEISLKRLKLILQLVNWEGVRQIAQMRYSNIRQAYRLPDLEQITKEDINGDGQVSPTARREIRVKNKQVVDKIDPETEMPMGVDFIPADGYIDFFELDPADLEDYDLSITFQLNTSKELKKLRFQEAINVLPVLLQVAQVNLLNPANILEFWADVYEIPQTILNKNVDASSNQLPLGVPQPKPGEGTAGAPGAGYQMAPQTPTQGKDVAQFAQQDFNIAQPQM